MRLPADATLIVVGEPDAARDGGAAAKVAALIEAWRREDLPAVDLRDVADASRAFADGGLQARLDDFGATTLVLCGEGVAVEAVAREAAALGFHAFIVLDACWKLGAAPSIAPALRSGELGAAVDAAAALVAATPPKARQRRDASRRL